jgi:hypothetical protein
VGVVYDPQPKENRKDRRGRWNVPIASAQAVVVRDLDPAIDDAVPERAGITGINHRGHTVPLAKPDTPPRSSRHAR